MARWMQALALSSGVAAICAALPAHALSECTYQGIPLYGEVTVVSGDADLLVEVVQSGGDLKVQWTDTYADKCGRWRKVGMGADFTIQIVPSGGDIKIQEVAGGPGLL